MKKAANTVSIIGAVFLIVGVFFIILGFVLFASAKKFQETAEQTTAVITRIDTYRSRTAGGDHTTEHDVYIEYIVDGVEYNAQLDTYNSSMYEGKEIEVYYDPDNPKNVKGGGSGLLLIMSAIGAVFAVIGGSFVINDAKKRANMKMLLENGEVMTGVITNIVMDMSISINGVHPYKAECEVTDPYTGEKYLYCSDSVMEDISYMEGAEVTVYVDRDDRSKNYIDLDTVTVNSEYGESRIHDFR